MKIGDLVKWMRGGSYHNLQGIVVDTRTSFDDTPEAKVIWDNKSLGSLKQRRGGAWQRADCLKVLSSMEIYYENR